MTLRVNTNWGKPMFHIQGGRHDLDTEFVVMRDAGTDNPKNDRVFISMSQSKDSEYSANGHMFTGISGEEAEELIIALQMVVEGNKRGKDLL